MKTILKKNDKLSGNYNRRMSYNLTNNFKTFKNENEEENEKKNEKEKENKIEKKIENNKNSDINNDIDKKELINQDNTEITHFKKGQFKTYSHNTNEELKGKSLYNKKKVHSYEKSELEKEYIKNISLHKHKTKNIFSKTFSKKITIDKSLLQDDIILNNILIMVEIIFL